MGDWPAWHAATGTAGEDVAHGSAAAPGTWRHQVEVTLRTNERQPPPGGRPRKVPDTRADWRAAARLMRLVCLMLLLPSCGLPIRG